MFESTQFAFARFFVPYECHYKGKSVFVDSDFLFLEPIDELLDLYDSKYAVMCCKHRYQVSNSVKMNGKIQSDYPMKNWSSLMVINNEHDDTRQLTPEVVNSQTGKYLHRFEWVSGDIGSIPIEWNWLVGIYNERDDFKPKALHFTNGGPWLEDYKNCEYSDVWNEHLKKI